MKVNNIAKYVLVVVILAPIVFAVNKDLSRKFNAKYTIGVTTGSEGGGWVGYSYIVNDVGYDGTRRSLKFSPDKRGGRYYVEFSSKSPGISTILWDQPVPDRITEAPPEGWSAIPK
ncbi:MAG: hypothetical protein HWD62_02750 [Cyclobacteriaceae bacterium]|nr:MAG: hypothetical protein HWD62_02750 [Cyclobacteriaceae bacterium]